MIYFPHKITIANMWNEKLILIICINDEVVRNKAYV